MALTTVGTNMISSGGGSIATNTALGNNALNSNTTGSFNDAFGSNAAASNTTGTNINAFGAYTLNKNTTGIVNSAFGGSNTIPALYNNTTGSYNCAFGTGALFSNTTSNNNTAVGYQAGYSNTTGTRNAFFGDGAGFTQTGASGNTFIGRNAGRLTTGQGNTFVGFEAGYSVTTGNNNTFIGPAYAGINGGVGDVMTTGSNNVIIGRFTGNQSGLDIRTSNNFIVISDGDGNPRFGSNSGNLILFGTNNYLTSYNSSLYAYGNLGSTSGVYLANNATSWASTSDERRKDIIEPIADAVNKVSQLRAVIGKFKVDEEGTRRPFLIAQDVQAVLPEAVQTQEDEDGEFLGMSYTDVVPLLVAAIKELKTEVDSLKAQLEAK